MLTKPVNGHPAGGIQTSATTATTGQTSTNAQLAVYAACQPGKFVLHRLDLSHGDCCRCELSVALTRRPLKTSPLNRSAGFAGYTKWPLEAQHFLDSIHLAF
jgi:hypothetical protein